MAVLPVPPPAVPPPAGALPAASAPGAGAPGAEAPPGAGAAGGGAPGGDAPRAGRPSWAWTSALGVRRGRDRWVAGVCSGTAERLAVDPLLVRVAVVVLALVGGAGVALYALAWLLLPDADGRVEGRRALAGDVSAAAAVALVALVAAVAVPAPDRWWHPGVLVGGSTAAGVLVAGVVVLALALWLPGALHPARGRARPGDAPVGAGGSSATGGPRAASSARPAPRGADRARRRRLPRPVVGAVGGLAILVGDATWWVAARAGLPAGVLPGQRVTGVLTGSALVAVVAAAVALVLAAGTIAAGIAGRSGGGLSGLAALAVVVAVVAAALPTGWSSRSGSATTAAVGDARWTPTGLADARRGFRAVAGDARVDLSRLPLPAGGVVRVPVHLTAGDLALRVPAGAAVTVRSRVGAGQVAVPRRWSGPSTTGGLGLRVTSAGPGPSAAGRVVVTAVVGAGQVEVEES